MIKERKFSASQTKKFAEEQVEDVLDVKVLDQEGNPIDEATLTQEQINFAAKVAGKAYRKFAASKRVMFSSEEEVIEVTLPEELSDVTAEEVAEAIVAEREMVGDPNEVVAEIELDPLEDGEVRQFASEDLDKGNELEKQLETAIDNQDKHEEIDPENPNPENLNGLEDMNVKKFARQSLQATNDAIDQIIGNDTVASYKQKFFASATPVASRRR